MDLKDNANAADGKCVWDTPKLLMIDMSETQTGPTGNPTELTPLLQAS